MMLISGGLWTIIPSSLRTKSMLGRASAGGVDKCGLRFEICSYSLCVFSCASVGAKDQRYGLTFGHTPRRVAFLFVLLDIDSGLSGAEAEKFHLTFVFKSQKVVFESLDDGVQVASEV